ncbi:hypothetical protein HMPREF9541_04036 [Escherichia coli MS 116-1]|nr:hypothetical protein HMPREF9541_04036 [Escherichia coli MS 116-1]
MRSRHDTADYICYTTFASLALLAVMKKAPPPEGVGGEKKKKKKKGPKTGALVSY